MIRNLCEGVITLGLYYYRGRDEEYTGRHRLRKREWNTFMRTKKKAAKAIQALNNDLTRRRGELSHGH